MQHFNRLLSLTFLLYLSNLTCGQVKKVKEERIVVNGSAARQLLLPFLSNLRGSDQAEQGKHDEGKSDESLLGSLGLDNLDPTKIGETIGLITTTTTTTTTPAPVDKLMNSISKIPDRLINRTRLTINTPIKMINGVMEASNLGDSAFDKTTDHLMKSVSESTGGLLPSKVPEAPMVSNAIDVASEIVPDIPILDELTQSEDDKKPYLSQECAHRIACELGKAMKFMAHPIAKAANNNKIIQDLQNRYTMAVTYGAEHGDCERYYCVVAQFLGGPKEFSGGVVDMTNRVMNPELYPSPV